MNAYDVMHEWDRVAGIEERSDADLDRDVPVTLATDYAEWKSRIEARDVSAITEGLKAWGLPVGPLGGFEIDAAIGTVERPD